MQKNELSFKELYTPCSLKSLSFKTTKDVENNSEVIGQEKAIDAILFAMNMPDDGYNVFCLGAEGNGKKSLIFLLFCWLCVNKMLKNSFFCGQMLFFVL